jgi:hypothetical protein
MTKLPVHDFYITSRPKRDWLTQHIRARELDEAMQYAKDGLPEGREFGRPEEVLSVEKGAYFSLASQPEACIQRMMTGNASG